MQKFTITCYFILFATISLHQQYIKDELKRELASKSTPSRSIASSNCHSGLRYLMRRNSRGRQFIRLVRAGDIAGVKRLFWDSHEKEKLTAKIPATRITRWLRARNQSTYVPALFQTKNSFVKNLNGEDVDTFSTIWKVIDDEIGYNDDEVKAVANVRSWLAHIRRYPERIDGFLENSIEYHRQIDTIRNLEWEPWMSDIDGEGVTLPMVVYHRNDDGTLVARVENSRFYPTSQLDIDFKIENLEHETSTIFAGNFTREARKKSRLYEAMLDQALYWRRLELINERFGRVAIDKMSEEQRTLMREVRELLNDYAYAPRTDAMAWVKRREARVEFWQAMRLWRSNRVAQDMEFELPKFMLDRSASISPVALATPLFFVVSGTITSSLTYLYQDNPHYQYYMGVLGDSYNKFFLNILRWPNAAMRTCIDADRHWTREEISQSAVVDTYLSRWSALNRLEPNENHLDSEEYNRDLDALLAECIYQSNLRGSMEVHQRGKDALQSNQVHRLVAHRTLSNIIYEYHPQGRFLDGLIFEYFEEREYSNEVRTSELRGEIVTLTSEEFFQQLDQYEQDLEYAEELIYNGRFENNVQYFDSFEDFLNYVGEIAAQERAEN